MLFCAASRTQVRMDGYGKEAKLERSVDVWPEMLVLLLVLVLVLMLVLMLVGNEF